MPALEVQVGQCAYRYALAPTPEQEQKLRSHAGAARYAYNRGVQWVADALDASAAAPEGSPKVPIPTHFDLCKMWTEFKDDPANELHWVGENFVGTYQAALRDAHAAWTNFFKSRSGKRAGRRMGRPRFKSRHKSRISFQVHGTTLGTVSTRKAANTATGRMRSVQTSRYLKLPKIGEIRTFESVRKLTRLLRRHDELVEPWMAVRARHLAALKAAKKLLDEPAVPSDGASDPAAARSALLDRVGRLLLELLAPPKTRKATAPGDPYAHVAVATEAVAALAHWADPRVGINALIAIHRVAEDQWVDPISIIGDPGFVAAATMINLAARDGRADLVELVKATVKTEQRHRRPCVASSGRIVRGTVALHSDGRWYIALTVEVQRLVRVTPSKRQEAGGVVGVDFGVREIATCSDGTVIANPRYLDPALDRLKRLQKAVSRAQPGSRRRDRARRVLGKAHARVAHLRQDATHKATSNLVHSYRLIVMEGFDLQRLAEHGSADLPARERKRRNRSLMDANIGTARYQVGAKAPWYGAKCTIIDKTQATGRTCSRCGQVRAKPVPPAEQQFHCPACGWRGDRRANTARLLAAIGRGEHNVDPSGGETQNARGEDVRPGAPRRARQSPMKRVARPKPGEGAHGVDPGGGGHPHP